MQTVWILGDQLNRNTTSLSGTSPANTRVLFVVSQTFLASRPWHRQRVHVVLAGMRRLALSLADEGFNVDWRIAETMGEGLRQHVAAFSPASVRVMEPAEVRLRALVQSFSECEVVSNDQFLCSTSMFTEWASTRKGRLRMEDFYRFQRTRLDVLMDGDEPAGGQWNLDHENREPPPKDGRSWPEPSTYELDEVDQEIAALINQYAPQAIGAEWHGLWPTTTEQAHERLGRVISEVLPRFGPHEDAMLKSNWLLAHTALSSSMNLGMLSPRDVVHAAEDAYRNGTVPLASAEGFIRQIIGWREYVYGLAHYWGAEYGEHNQLEANVAVPIAFRDSHATNMACVAQAVDGIDQRAYAHHIQRLMVLGNLALLAGVNPQAMTAWMRESFIDGADWVMAPNVIGMSLHADGGMMATKPYASGGAYINKMSDSCKGCKYDPKLRTGPTACPFTTLYWDFLARHQDRLKSNHRMSQPLAGLKRLSNLDDVRRRAVEVQEMLLAGTL
jgi:deoxyribodipyrimidine photolyase-related protein